MRQFCFALLEAILASPFLILLFRHLNRSRFQNRKKTALYFLFSFYLCGMYAVAGLPSITYIRFRSNINLTPFLYMFSAFSSSFLNVLLFVPMGCFLTILWKRFRNPGWNLLMGLGLSVTVEILQLFTFRATDINDLMTNTFGTLLGWLLGRILILIHPESAFENPAKELSEILFSVFLIMFFLQPVLSSLIRCLF